MTDNREDTAPRKPSAPQADASATNTAPTGKKKTGDAPPGGLPPSSMAGQSGHTDPTILDKSSDAGRKKI
ncbi:MAG: hypothetical protein ABI442_11280 [Gemmatimonadaceae bacterium]